jgi:N-acetylneuraminic acid mutarotase
MNGSTLLTAAASALAHGGFGEWSPAGELPVARALFGYPDGGVLLADGKVLVAGGTDGGRTTVDGAVLFDPETSTWRETGAPATARRAHSVTRLPDGRVLVAGGETGPLRFPVNGLATAELYDPATGEWTPTGSMNTPRSGHSATLLPTGKVLVAGGTTGRSPQTSRSVSSAELYDPATGEWTPTGMMTDARSYHVAVLLGNGTVLVIGGFLDTERGDGPGLAFCELYDPAAGTWAPTGNLGMPRSSHTATVLADGTVFVTGGWPSFVPVGWNYQAYSLWTTERYDPATGTWSVAENMPCGRALHRAAPLPSGNVLVVGGIEAANPDAGYATAAIYDPVLRTWDETASMSVGRFGFTTVRLTDGRILVASGIETAGLATPNPGNDITTATAEIFTE